MKFTQPTSVPIYSRKADSFKDAAVIYLCIMENHDFNKLLCKNHFPWMAFQKHINRKEHVEQHFIKYTPTNLSEPGHWPTTPTEIVASWRHRWRNFDNKAGLLQSDQWVQASPLLRYTMLQSGKIKAKVHQIQFKTPAREIHCRSLGKIKKLSIKNCPIKIKLTLT